MSLTRAGFSWIAAHAADIGLNPEALHLTGNSAGAHLAAMVAAEYPARSLGVISGLFDKNQDSGNLARILSAPVWRRCMKGATCWCGNGPCD